MARKGGLTRWQRRAIAAGGVAALLAVALLLFAELRDSGSYDHIVLTLPQTGDARPVAPADAGSSASAPTQTQTPPGESASGPSAAGAAVATGGLEPAVAPAAVPSAPVLVTTAVPSGERATVATPAATAVASSVATTAQAAGNATYQLQIKPWGVVYVDGVDRGVSPPVKRLVLAPGHHTIRISNPNFRDSMLEFDSAQTTSIGKISVDFNHDAN